MMLDNYFLHHTLYKLILIMANIDENKTNWNVNN